MAPFESITRKWTCSMSTWGQRVDCNVKEEVLTNERVLSTAEANKYYAIEKGNFDNHLSTFLEMFNKKMRRTPTINSKPLDLYRLYREVSYHNSNEQKGGRGGECLLSDILENVFLF